MKIAWIVYGTLAPAAEERALGDGDPRTGGTIYDAEIVRGLRQLGDDVHVLDARAPWAGGARARSGPARRIGVGDVAASILRALARWRPDVVVGDELCHRELAAIFAARTASKRVLLVHHLTAWETELSRSARARARFYESIALRTADHVIATSAPTRDRLALEGCRTSIDVVLPGADRLPPARPCGDRPERTTAFLFVGAIIPRKRVLDLVSAMKHVEGARLTVVGSRDRDPVYAAAVERVISAPELRDRVRLAGELSDAELAIELASADALVLPSSLEGYGIVATEAVRAGVPVIAARTPGPASALASCAEAALLFEESGEAAIANALVRVRPSLPAMRAAAKELAAHLPTWEASTAAFRAALTRRVIESA